MGLFHPKTYTVKRIDTAQTQHPITKMPINGLETTFTIRASVQPMTGSELQALEEGRRNRKNYKIYTKADLRENDEELKYVPDVIVFNDGTKDLDLEIVQKRAYKSGIISHYRYEAVAK